MSDERHCVMCGKAFERSPYREVGDTTVCSKLCFDEKLERERLRNQERGRTRQRRVEAYPILVGMLKLGISSCGCTPMERDSGHRVECWAPEASELLDQLDETKNPP